MFRIGLRNLKKERLRVMVVVLGVTFAVVLVTVEIGMLLGLVRNASILIDDSRADLWVTKTDVKTFDFATPFERRNRWLIQAVPGVERVEEFNASYTMWRLPSGGNTSVQVVGLEDRGSLAAPLRLISGSLEELRNQDAVIIDESERAKLGNPELGDSVEIMNHRARIVGFTRGMRSFTTTPFIFTSIRRSHRYGWLTEKGRLALYYLVKVKPGFDVDAVRRAIQANMEGVEVHTRESFSLRTRMYWLFETGVGFGFLAASVLGLLVGGVTTSQTLYTMTLDKLPEFAVLKALGSSMLELSSVVLSQSLLCGVMGLAIGLGASFALAPVAELAGTTVLIPWPLVVGVAVLTVCLCSGASIFSILRLRRVDPAMVVRL